MKKETKQLLSIGGYMAKWLLITAIIGLFMGALSAFFLKSLTYVTDVRLANPCYSLSSPLAVSFLRISIRVLGKMLAEEIT